MPNVINIGVKNVVAPSRLGVVQLPDKSLGLDGGGGGGGATGLCNIFTFTDGFSVGFRGPPPINTSTSDNVNPTPPGVGGVALLQISQFNSLIWQVRFQPAVIAQNAWTSVTCVGTGSVTLFSAAATYTANSFGSSLWSFGVTADIWNSLGAGANVTATFA